MIEIYPDYLHALLAGDQDQCRRMVRTLIENGIPVHTLYTDYFQRSLYQVGELWEGNRISVADEHLATAITESLMPETYPVLFGADHIGRSAVVSCVANEYHQIGGKMVADTFEMHGWNSYFLGANTPVADLLALVAAKKPDVVALSLTVFFGLGHLLDAISALGEAFPALPVWVGGQAFRWGAHEQVSALPNAALLGSLAELETRIAAWEAPHAG